MANASINSAESISTSGSSKASSSCREDLEKAPKIHMTANDEMKENEILPLNGNSTSCLAGIDFSGFLHIERAHSFISKQWPPWENVKENQMKGNNGPGTTRKRKRSSADDVETSEISCTIDDLATAGFRLNNNEVQCVFCLKGKKQEEFTKASVPWNIHEELNPQCPYIKLGKPAKPDDIKLEDLIYLIGESQVLKLEHQFSLAEKQSIALVQLMKNE